MSLFFSSFCVWIHVKRSFTWLESNNHTHAHIFFEYEFKSHDDIYSFPIKFHFGVFKWPKPTNTRNKTKKHTKYRSVIIILWMCLSVWFISLIIDTSRNLFYGNLVDTFELSTHCECVVNKRYVIVTVFFFFFFSVNIGEYINVRIEANARRDIYELWIERVCWSDLC